MSFFPFNTGIPDANNDPSVDQPDMLQNNVSTSGIISVDHVGFNDLSNKGGYHHKVTFDQTLAVTPGFGTGVAVFYGGTNAGNCWPHWNNVLGNVLMLNGIPSVANPGYTYLPGGILVQWGFVNGTHGGAPQKLNNHDFANQSFPITFTTCFTVYTTLFYDNTSVVPQDEASIVINRPGGVIANNQFTWTFLGSSGEYTGFFWAAIGF